MWEKIKKQKVISLLIVAASLLALLVGGVLVMNQTFKLSAEDFSGEIKKNQSVEAKALDPNLYPPSFGQLSAVKFRKTLTYEMGGVAVDTAGSVWSWGYNLYGSTGVQQYGDGTPLSTTGAVNGYLGGMKKIEYFEDHNINIIDISTGYRSHLALDSLGNVYAWGNGSYGEMGQGNTNSTNAIPKKISTLSNIKKIFTGDQGDRGLGAANFAIDEDDNIWAWGGNSTGKLGVGNTTVQTTPIKVTVQGMTAKPVKIASGERQTHIIDEDGNIWYAGGALNGALGNGTTTGDSNVFKKLVPPAGMSKAIDISTGHATTLVLDDNNVVWQWGQVAGRYATEVYETVTTPRKVEIDMNDSLANFNKGYTPIPQKVFAGRLNYYFVDQYGRPWSWGGGVKFGYGTDTGYEDGNDIARTKAVQIPNVMGDGDTQIYNSDAKLPRYLSNPNNPSGRLPSGSYGVYSFNSLHPTIYDHKYMSKDEQGNYLDEEGNKLKYQSSNASGRIAGFFYKLDDSGQLTSETGVPMVDPEEKLWIDLAGQEVPAIEHIHASYESFVMTDVDGNIYKWGTTGSGAMAWGWDYEPEYDSNGDARRGLFDRYTYEIMFMRGAPRLPQPDVKIRSSLEKIYFSNPSNAEETTVDVMVNIPPVIESSQMGLVISSQVHNVKAIVMPYDTMDENMKKNSPTSEDIELALLNPDYKILDLMEEAGMAKPTENDSKTDWKKLEFSSSINGNSVVWLVVDYAAYDHNNHLQKISVQTFDNYYKLATINHQGVQHTDTSKNVYDLNTENVEKTTEDGINDLVGFPLDKNGVIIGTPTAPPTFGYDEVKVTKLADAQLEALETNFTKYWTYFTPQTDSKVYTLDGVDAPNNEDITKATGSLKVTDKYTHLFHYEKNPTGFAKVHYIGVDADGNKIDSFTKESEEVKKGVELVRAPIDLTAEQYIATEYKVIDGKPPTAYPINLAGSSSLNTDGKASFTIPFDDKQDTEITVVFIYTPPFGTLHVRQVVLDNNENVDIPRSGYMTIIEANPGSPWVYGKQSMNLMTESQLENDQPTYSDYKVPLSKDYMGYGLKHVLPQYYEYVGYKISEKNGNYDATNPNASNEVKIDYSTNLEYWVTIYLKPRTSSPDNYTWGTTLNEFGQIHLN